MTAQIVLTILFVANAGLTAYSVHRRTYGSATFNALICVYMAAQLATL